jgi:hypothetical protein
MTIDESGVPIFQIRLAETGDGDSSRIAPDFVFQARPLFFRSSQETQGRSEREHLH